MHIAPAVKIFSRIHSLLDSCVSGQLTGAIQHAFYHFLVALQLRPCDHKGNTL